MPYVQEKRVDACSKYASCLRGGTSPRDCSKQLASNVDCMLRHMTSDHVMRFASTCARSYLVVFPLLAHQPSCLDTELAS